MSLVPVSGLRPSAQKALPPSATPSSPTGNSKAGRLVKKTLRKSQEAKDLGEQPKSLCTSRISRRGSVNEPATTAAKNALLNFNQVMENFETVEDHAQKKVAREVFFDAYINLGSAGEVVRRYFKNRLTINEASITPEESDAIRLLNKVDLALKFYDFMHTLSGFYKAMHTFNHPAYRESGVFYNQTGTVLKELEKNMEAINNPYQDPLSSNPPQPVLPLIGLRSIEECKRIDKYWRELAKARTISSKPHV